MCQGTYILTYIHRYIQMHACINACVHPSINTCTISQACDSDSNYFSPNDLASVEYAKRMLESVRPNDWFPAYGCVLLRSEEIDHFRLTLLGLDGWQYDLHT
jgi:hypothetical protein